MNERCWDETLQRLGGNLLQSWRWGEFKKRQGWSVHRLAESDSGACWMAQLLIKHMGPVSVAYVPCGPTLGGDHARAFPRMMAEIDRVCADERAITLIMEPNQRFQLEETFKQRGFVKWMNPFQPRSTMVVPVADDETMLARMHHKTRYHVRLAQRQGMVIESQLVTASTIAAFHALHAETVNRNDLLSLSPEYFADLLDAFGDHAELIFAIADGQPAAGVLLVRYGAEASYLFAGSAQQNRGQGAGASLVFRGLQWAREHGCEVLDLGNAGSEGLRKFKSGFAGVTHEFPPALERRYHPLLAFGARRMLARRAI
jgi:lipid II:glycine glycyltransferase (peptidoglycan interpeptide bridge formation enzyme)